MRKGALLTMQVDLAGQIAVLSNSAAGLEAVIADSLAANGASVETIDEFRPDRLAAIAAEHGRLDLLVNLALGIEVSAVGPIERLCRAAAEVMEGSGGRIVTIVSALGTVPTRSESAVAAGAAAVIAATRALALEFGPRNVRVNAMTVGASEIDPALAARLVTHVPLARAATSGEIAAALLFLLDPANTYTTGHVLTVDGGWTAGYARNF